MGSRDGTDTSDKVRNGKQSIEAGAAPTNAYRYSEQSRLPDKVIGIDSRGKIPTGEQGERQRNFLKFKNPASRSQLRRPARVEVR
jgi:hypothetical protein